MFWWIVTVLRRICDKVLDFCCFLFLLLQGRGDYDDFSVVVPQMSGFGVSKEDSTT